MMRSIALAALAAACKDKPKETGTVIKPAAFADLSFEAPDGWSSHYDKDTDALQLASADGKTTVRIERADERYVASPDAYMQHLAPHWPGKLVTIEDRENSGSGFELTLGIYNGEGDRNPLHSTVVVRKLGAIWFRCMSEGAYDETIRTSVIQLCRSVHR
jgi:hypothetical protein